MAYTALEVEGGSDSRMSFPLQNNILVVPSMTAVEGNKVDFAVAVRTTSGQSSSPPVDIVISAPVRQQGTLAPKVTRHKAVPRPGTAVVVPGYQLWEGSVNLGDASVTGAVAVGAAATESQSEGVVVHDVLYLSAGVAGW